MGCSSCGPQLNGHFGRAGAYVKASPAQIFTTTGPVISAPNETAGMHVNRLSPVDYGALKGIGRVGDFTSEYLNFSPQPTDWFPGFPNGFVVVGGIALLVVAMSR